MDILNQICHLKGLNLKKKIKINRTVKCQGNMLLITLEYRLYNFHLPLDNSDYSKTINVRLVLFKGIYAQLLLHF